MAWGAAVGFLSEERKISRPRLGFLLIEQGIFYSTPLRGSLFKVQRPLPSPHLLFCSFQNSPRRSLGPLPPLVEGLFSPLPLVPRKFDTVAFFPRKLQVPHGLFPPNFSSFDGEGKSFSMTEVFLPGDLTSLGGFLFLLFFR